ncbi:ADCK1, partial [Symbiodinium natans]
YVVQVDRTAGDVLGLQVDETPDGRLLVLGVKPGLVQDWNDTHPSMQVLPGDILLAVNGQKRDANGLMDAELQASDHLRQVMGDARCF